MVDPYYTPSNLAISMATLGLGNQKRPNSVLDIACGAGALLDAIMQMAGPCPIYGIDVDDSTVATLTQRRPDWLLSAADALSRVSVARSQASKMWGRFDLSVLNPPFSCRGPRTVEVVVDDFQLRCSPHMAFVLTSISALSLGGRLVAILPAGARRIVRDAAAWAAIDGACKAVIGCKNGRYSFPKVAASTEIHVIDRERSWLEPSDARFQSSEFCKCYQPVRGWLQMHSVVEDTEGPLLVHSSNLANGDILVGSMKRVVTSRSLMAPAVLLPRVGKPNRLKVAIHRSGEVALSDCVFGVPCVSIQEAERLSARLKRSWQVIEDRYTGSCAPHLTLSNLRSGLCWIEHGSATPSSSAPYQTQTDSRSELTERRAAVSGSRR